MAEHVLPKRVYYTVFGILMVGTALTVLVAFYDLGPLNNVMMLTIAIVKLLVMRTAVLIVPGQISSS